MRTRVLWNLVKTWELISKPHHFNPVYIKEVKNLAIAGLIQINFEPDFEFGFMFTDSERMRRENIQSLIKWGDLDPELK